MTTIYGSVKAAHLQARKDKKAADVSSLSTLIGEMDKVATGPEKTVTDDVAVAVIKKTLKGVEEMIGYNNERAVEEKELFNTFLPQQLQEMEIIALIKEARRVYGFSTVGQIMSHMKAHYAGLYDGRFVSNEATRQLQDFHVNK